MEARMHVRSGPFVALALVLTAAAVADEPPARPPAEPDGMESLFNGRDLAGWDGDPRLWSVRGGVVHGETTRENPADGNTFLILEQGDVGDFELRLSFRCNAANNSGIQYRSKRITDQTAKNRWVVRGYQHEIRNENRLPNVPGFIYDEGGFAGGRGRICQVGERAVWPPSGEKQIRGTLIDQPQFETLMKVDDWNDVVIRAEGNHIRHWLNGTQILDFIDEHPGALAEGVIALQLHAGAPMWAEYRDIRLKKLP
ncbi:MAG: DUF1080 domain-containing protein [Planctomycetia bacterium]|nr:DUF1080 domain-containing protein [Planctomycetia bacterium]